MNYTVQYFIDKFEAIPEEKFCEAIHSKTDQDCHCYLGHCNMEGEGHALGIKLLHETLNTDAGSIVHGGNKKYAHLSYKQRILAALYDIKKMHQPTYENISKSLAVLPVSETSDVINQPLPANAGE